MYDRTVHADTVPWRNVDSAKLHATRRHGPAHGECNTGMHAKGFLDTGAEKGQLHGIRVLDRKGDLPVVGSLIDFGYELIIYGRVPHEMIEH